MRPKLLLVDDEETLRETLAKALRAEGWDVFTKGDGQAALEFLQNDNTVDIVITDLRMPRLDGRELLLRCREVAPQALVLIMTAYGSVDSAVEMMKLGARDYVTKPVSFDDMIVKIERLLEFRTLTEQNKRLRSEVERQWGCHDIIGTSQALENVLQVVRKVAETKSNVLIIGESGTGKELIARAIHFNGITKTGQFIAVNCGGIAETLVESEFFGHRKGAFTGAASNRDGYFKAADGGTLFLDEISNLPDSGQAAILRAVEDRAVIPVGDTRAVSVDLRLIAATNCDPTEMVSAGKFREDLYYRLSVVEIKLPPLRERRDDIPLLIQHFIAKYNAELKKQCPHVTDEAMQALLAHPWKGNIRELENVIERAIIFAGNDPIGVEHIPFIAQSQSRRYVPHTHELRTMLMECERAHIASVLQECGFDKHAAADVLGIGLSSLYRKMEELHISRGSEVDHDHAANS